MPDDLAMADDSAPVVFREETELAGAKGELDRTTAGEAGRVVGLEEPNSDPTTFEAGTDLGDTAMSAAVSAGTEGRITGLGPS